MGTHKPECFKKFLQSILLLFSKCTLSTHTYTYFCKKKNFSKITPVWFQKTISSIKSRYKMCNFFHSSNKKEKRRKVLHMSVNWINISRCQNRQMLVFIKKILNDQSFYIFGYFWLNLKRCTPWNDPPPPKKKTKIYLEWKTSSNWVEHSTCFLDRFETGGTSTIDGCCLRVELILLLAFSISSALTMNTDFSQPIQLFSSKIRHFKIYDK